MKTMTLFIRICAVAGCWAGGLRHTGKVHRRWLAAVDVGGAKDKANLGFNVSNW
jgi:hypothetical protein